MEPSAAFVHGLLAGTYLFAFCRLVPQTIVLKAWAKSTPSRASSLVCDRNEQNNSILALLPTQKATGYLLNRLGSVCFQSLCVKCGTWRKKSDPRIDCARSID